MEFKIILSGVYRYSVDGCTSRCRVSTGFDWPIVVKIQTTINILLLTSIFEETIQFMVHFIFLGVVQLNTTCITKYM